MALARFKTAIIEATPKILTSLYRPSSIAWVEPIISVITMYQSEGTGKNF